MKQIYLIVCLFILFTAHSQVGINTTTPNALLEIKASNQTTPAFTDGLIIPRVENFPSVNPSVNQDGMLVYLNTSIGINLKGFYYWDNASSLWVRLSDYFKNSIEDLDLDTKIQVEESVDEDIIRFDIAGSERANLADTTSDLDIQSGYSQSDGQFTLINTGLVLKPDGLTNRTQIVSIEGQWPGSNYPYARLDFRNNDQGTIYTGGSIRSHNDGSVNDGDLRFFTTNNQALSERMRINSSGNVSIGAVSNNDKFYLKMANATSFFPNWSSAANTVITQVYEGDTSNPQVRFVENSTSDFYDIGMNGSGNFTIEENDGEKFSINNGAIRFNNNYTFPISDGANGQLLSTNGSGNLSWINQTTQSLLADNDNDTKIQVEESADEDIIRFDISGNQKMMINNDGDLGIGTTTVDAPLHVKRTTEDAILLLDSRLSSFEARVEFKKFNNSFSSSIGYQPGNAELRIRTDQNNSILFETNASEKMRIHNDGNVGIGVSNPQEKLHIDGNIRMVDGNQATGKIMTSDANGTASWQSLTIPNQIVEKGTVSIPNSSSGESFVNVNFSNTYLTNPIVQISLESGNFGEFYVANVKYKSTTSFEIHVLRIDTPGSPVDSVTVDWIVISQ